MGYTHHWTHRRRFMHDEWKLITRNLIAILRQAQADGIGIGDADGASTPDDLSALVEVDDKGLPGDVLFNGRGAEAFETFAMTQERPPLNPWQRPAERGYGFCKTNAKPYDVAVTACLVYLSSLYPDNITVESDGDAEDWADGLDLARRALPGIARQLVLPPVLRFKALFDAERDALTGRKLGLAHLLDGTPVLVDRTAQKVLSRFTDAPEARDWLATWYERVTTAERAYSGTAHGRVLWIDSQLRTMTAAAEIHGYLSAPGVPKEFR